jgi:hypothetical protein
MKIRPLASRRVSSSHRRARVARITPSPGTSKPDRNSSAIACPNIGGWVIDDADTSGHNQADGGVGP